MLRSIKILAIVLHPSLNFYLFPDNFVYLPNKWEYNDPLLNTGVIHMIFFSQNLSCFQVYTARGLLYYMLSS